MSPAQQFLGGRPHEHQTQTATKVSLSCHSFKLHITRQNLKAGQYCSGQMTRDREGLLVPRATHFSRFFIAIPLLATAMAGALQVTSAIAADNPFQSLVGTWNGSGTAASRAAQQKVCAAKATTPTAAAAPTSASPSAAPTPLPKSNCAPISTMPTVPFPAIGKSGPITSRAPSAARLRQAS